MHIRFTILPKMASNTQQSFCFIIISAEVTDLEDYGPK